MNRMPRGNATLRGIGVIVGVTLAMAGVFRPSVQSQLEKECTDVNATCPKQINPSLRMDSLTPGPMRVTCNFTITTKLQMAGKELNNALEATKAEMTADARRNADLKPLLTKGVTIGFAFNDMNNKELLRFDIVGDK